MGRMVNSTEVVQQLKSDLSSSIRDIESISQSIRGAAAGDWSDEIGQQYEATMKKIAQLTTQPIGTLQAALPKLDKLAQAIDKYSRTRFG